MNRTIEDINQNEINPDLYLKREEDIRKCKIEKICGGIILLILLGIMLTLVQVAYGIW